jgi:hypothetical protein
VVIGVAVLEAMECMVYPELCGGGEQYTWVSFSHISMYTYTSQYYCNRWAYREGTETKKRQNTICNNLTFNKLKGKPKDKTSFTTGYKTYSCHRINKCTKHRAYSPKVERKASGVVVVGLSK